MTVAWTYKTAAVSHLKSRSAAQLQSNRNAISLLMNCRAQYIAILEHFLKVYIAADYIKNTIQR